jgi:hypothetical protein
MSIQSQHWTDPATEAPEGGQTYGPGFAIAWQRGPLGRGEDRKPQNGAFVEDVIKAAIDRIECYQASKFKSEYNATALEHLRAAVASLNARTADREKRAVEGTHGV